MELPIQCDDCRDDLSARLSLDGTVCVEACARCAREAKDAAATDREARIVDGLSCARCGSVELEVAGSGESMTVEPCAKCNRTLADSITVVSKAASSWRHADGCTAQFHDALRCTCGLAELRGGLVELRGGGGS